MFTHLHVHTHYSILEGLPTVSSLIEHAKKLNMQAVAVTDRHSMYGIIDFYQEAAKAGIKPIIGMEIALTSRNLEDRPSKNDKHFSLILIAMNDTGYKNLVKLTSESHLREFVDTPVIDRKTLAQHSEGLIAIVGGPTSEIGRAYIDVHADHAKNILKEYIQIFSTSRLFLEVQHRPQDMQHQRVNELMFEFGKEFGIDVIATNDVHYIDKSDAEAQDILSCIKEKKLLQDEHRVSLRSGDYAMKSQEEMRDVWQSHPEVIDNTQKIVDMCNVTIELGKIQLPHYTLPEGMTSEARLQQICEEGLAKRYQPELMDKAKERLAYELSVIEKTGYASYFLIVQDFINWAKNNGIVVGPGRGSAAGSIVAYLSNITDIDPIQYELTFERFLNPDRVSMPDIDTDFDDERRDDVIRYVEKKYGKDHVAQIITFGTMAARAALRDVGRVLGYTYSYCDRIAKLIPMFTSLEETLKEVPELAEMYANDPDCERLLNVAMKIEGLVRHSSIHACGVVITKHQLVEHLPIQYSSQEDQTVVTQYSLHPVEDLGLLKMDFLGLKNLTIIRNTLDIIFKTTGQKIEIDKLPLDDKKTYHLLQKGETTGVFQFESSGMKRYLKELKSTEIEDLIAMVSLYRPGPMEFIPEYIAGKHGKKKIEYLYPALEPILGKTYGIAVYQEQIMEIARKLARFTFGEADVLRKAVGKKNKELLIEQETKMIQGMTKNGISQKIAQQIWDFILPFARYGFNRSHAACYAMIAYQTAYLKANFPAQFMAALMTSDRERTERIATEVLECRQMGIEVLQPDVNESYSTFTVVRETVQEKDNKPRIRFGLEAIKNVGSPLIRNIIDERKANGRYTNLQNFLTRVKHKDLNRKSLESLIKAGAMDTFNERALLLHNFETLLQYAKHAQTESESGQSNLFQHHKENYIPPLYLENAPKGDVRERLQWEKKLLGLYISDHPLRQYKDVLLKKAMPINELKTLKSNAVVKVCGMVTRMKKIVTKKGDQMLFGTLEDYSDDIEILIFPKTYKESSFLWVEDATLLIEGKVSTKDKMVKVIAEKVSELDVNEISKLSNWGVSQDHVQQKRTKKQPTYQQPELLTLQLPVRVSKEIFLALKKIFDANPGKCKVRIHIMNADKSIAKTMETQTKVQMNPAMLIGLSEIIGRENIIMSEQKKEIVLS